MKKLIAILLAVAMIMGLAMVASADTLEDIEFGTNAEGFTWWLAHTNGVEVKAGEIMTMTFTNTSTGTGNWNCPIWVLYSGDEGKVGGAGYLEYWVHRADNYGWGNNGYYNVALQPNADGVAELNTACPDNLTSAGIKHEATFAEGFDWANFPTSLQAGCECTVTAYLDGEGNAVVSMDVAGIKNVMTLPVDSSKTVYLSLTGELTKLTNITYSYAPIDDGEGDDTTGGDDTTTGGDDTTTEDTTKDPYTLPDLDCSGWWAAHSEGIELDESGVQLTFKSTTYETASSNWNGPLWVLYTGDEAKVNGAGYLEYWVHRLDNYGWGNNQYYGVTLPADDANAGLNTAYPDLIAAAGIKHEATFAEGFVWEELVANLKAGIDVTVYAQLVGKNAVITMTGAGITNTMTIPVDTSKPVYLSLTGELNTITDIDVIPQTGDTTNLIALGAAMVLAAAGVAAITVGKKKFF